LFFHSSDELRCIA